MEPSKPEQARIAAAQPAVSGARAAGWRAALLYSAFGTAWILWSDGLLFGAAEAVPALALLSRWKGLMFVALSAAILYGVVRHAHAPKRAARTAGKRPTDVRLVIIFGLAAQAIVGIGLAGAISAAREERDEVRAALRAVVAAKSSIWSRWLRERQRDVELQRDDPELVQLVLQQASGGGAGPALTQHLRRLCERLGCIEASLRPSDGSSWPAAGAARGAGAADSIELTADGIAGRAALALRFDTRAMLVELLRPDGLALQEAQLRLSRSDGSARTVLRHDAGERLAAATGRLDPADAAGATPPAIGTAARDFEATDLAGTRIVGVATAPGRLGWTLSAHIEQAQLYRRAWGEIWWIVVGDLAALVCAVLCAFGLHQRRELAFSRRARSQQQERLRVAGLLDANITERRRQELRHRQWAQAFESTRDGVVIADVQGRVETVNPAFTDITGYAPDEIIGRTPALLQSGRHDKAFYGALWSSLKAQGHWSGEIWNRRRNGEVYPEWLTISAVRGEDGAVSNYVGVFTDITRIKEDEARLERLANFDPLTRLPNRRLMLARLDQALAQGLRHGRRTALLYIDLDGFKTVNDSLGHPAGDELLTCIAERLGQRLRQGDTLGRLGGDEFLVIVESVVQPDDVAALARDLLASVAQPVMLSGGREAYVTASIGISLHPEDGAGDATELLRDADAAMYRAKAQGRNGFSFYTQELNAQAVSKLDTEAALNRALERDELLLHFQPKVDAASGRIVGAEGLLRWQRDGELVSPGRFIPLAETSSLILQIGDRVIDQACSQLRRWHDSGLPMPRIAVNVAARQFAAGNLDRVVRDALQRHGVPADRLEIELTESMLVEKPERGIALLGRLRALGVKLSLDDFGTGYSSLAYLRQFPIDALKIDKSFVDQIGHGPDGSAIVDAVIELAHRLRLVVVAEGVETAAQRAHLRQRGCDVLQGYLVGRPVPAAAFEALWRAQGVYERDVAA